MKPVVQMSSKKVVGQINVHMGMLVEELHGSWVVVPRGKLCNVSSIQFHKPVCGTGIHTIKATNKSRQ